MRVEPPPPASHRLCLKSLTGVEPPSSWPCRSTLAPLSSAWLLAFRTRRSTAAVTCPGLTGLTQLLLRSAVAPPRFAVSRRSILPRAALASLHGLHQDLSESRRRRLRLQSRAALVAEPPPARIVSEPPRRSRPRVAAGLLSRCRLSALYGRHLADLASPQSLCRATAVAESPPLLRGARLAFAARLCCCAPSRRARAAASTATRRRAGLVFAVRVASGADCR